MASSSRQPRKWTPMEDQKLREEVEAQIISSGDVKDWCKIATQLPGRTNKDCRKRWHNSVAGGLKKGQWSKSEDMLLARGVEQFGQRWTLVANCVESRSADQCAKRWQQSLDPELDRSEWTEEEDRILIQATSELGRHWKDIQREYFQGRSKNCIKNRYTVLVRRYQNQPIPLPSRPSSPSDITTPGARSPYLPDEDFSFNTGPDGLLMPPRSSSGRPVSCGSWSSSTSAAPEWPSVPEPDYSYQIGTLSDPIFDEPQPYHTPVSADPWNMANAHMQSQSSHHARSPAPYYNEAHYQPHYDDYSTTRPPMTSNRSYSTSPARTNYQIMPHYATTNVARSSSWPEQQHYHSLSPPGYEDPRLQQNPSYRY